MNKLTGLSAFLLLCVFGDAVANEYWEACNGCSAEEQRRAAVQAVPLGEIGRFDVYVMDFTGETVRKYRVSLSYAPRDEGYLLEAVEAATESDVTWEFGLGVRAIKEDIRLIETGTIIPEQVAASAFDVIHSSVTQGRVSDYVNDHLNFWQSLGMPVAVPLSAFGRITGLNFVIPVTFADGSTAKFLLTGLEGSIMGIRYAFEFEVGSGRDADGNLIPSNPGEAAPYAGEFSSHAAADLMTEFIGRWYSFSGSAIDCRSYASGATVTVVCKRS